MGPGARLAVVVWLAVAGVGAAVDKKFNITVGYLPSLTGELRDRQGLTISGAFTIALEEINNSTEILPDVKILLEYHDTKSDTTTATRSLVDMSCSGVVAFFGPEGRCYTEALIAHTKNLPMISYKCSDYRTSSLPNVIKLGPSGDQATKSVISLLRYYRWNKFSILYEEPLTTVALMLENHAKNNNMTVNHQRPVIDAFKCCEEKLTCCVPGYISEYIRDTKTKTRIYVFLGSPYGLLDMMSVMDMQHLFDKGEYMVIFVDMNSYSPTLGRYYLTRPEDSVSRVCLDTEAFKKRARSLLVVVSSEPSSSSYANFTDKVLEYNKAEPFNFPEGLRNIKKHVSIYAAHLYDSVKMYATALDDLIKEDTREIELTYAKLMSIANNGSRITQRIIKRSPYYSVAGLPIRLNKRGESEGSFSLFSVLAYKQTRFNDSNCSNNMVPVGHFQQNLREYPEYKLNPRLPIDWADGVKPEDEPLVGFNSAVRAVVSLYKTKLTAMLLILYLFES